MQDRDPELLKRQILRDTGFDCSQYRGSYLKRRLAIRMRANNVESYRDYAEILKGTPPEYEELLEALTISVTEFFRDPDVFEDFEKVVIPRLISDKKGKKQKVIRIWSAGSASGEEPRNLK